MVVEKPPQKIIAVLTNPCANRGQGQKYGAEVLRYLRNIDILNDFIISDFTGNCADDSVNRILHADCKPQIIIVVGGDGMVSLGINIAIHLNIPFAIIPCGSGNDFARELELPINQVKKCVEKIAQAVVKQEIRKIDVGHVISTEDNGKRINRYFVGQLSCGVDAQIADDANKSRILIGKLRYLYSALYEITHLKNYGYHIAAKIVRDNKTRTISFHCQTPLLFIANSRFVGGGIKTSPQSSITDGFLDMIWLKWKPHFAESLSLLYRGYKGTHIGLPIFGDEKTTEVTLNHSSPGQLPPPVSADGEIIGKLPVTVTLDHQRLKVLIPSVEKEYDSVTKE